MTGTLDSSTTRRATEGGLALPAASVAAGMPWRQQANAVMPAPGNDDLRHLEANGYLVSAPHPEDGHARVVRLIERGRSLQAAIYTAGRQVEREWQCPSESGRLSPVAGGRAAVRRAPPAGRIVEFLRTLGSGDSPPLWRNTCVPLLARLDAEGDSRTPSLRAADV